MNDMKKERGVHDLLGVFLAAVTGLALFAALMVRAFLPRVIIPSPNASMLIVLTLAALLLDHYISPDHRRCYPLLPLFGGLIFGLFPLAAILVAPIDALKMALLGAVIATVVTFLFDSMVDRLSTGPATKIAPIVSAFCLFLAAQCFAGII